MTREEVKEVLDRVLDWPAEDQAKLVGFVRELEQWRDEVIIDEESKLGASSRAYERSRHWTIKNKRVTQKEFDRIMRAIKEQTREYPQAALEDIFLYLEWIEKKYGIGDGASGGE